MQDSEPNRQFLDYCPEDVQIIQFLVEGVEVVAATKDK